MNGHAEGIRTIPRMCETCQGPWHPATTQQGAWLATMFSVVLMLMPIVSAAAAPADSVAAITAHAAPSSSTAMWLFLMLAFVLVAGLAFALGGWRQRAALTAPLFEARASRRQVQQLLQDQHRWQTDAQHQLLRWQPPGQAPSSDGVVLRQFEPALQAALQAQQSFVGLQVRAEPAVLATQRWEWRGVAQHDETGSFIGFVGTARPLDDTIRQSLQALALPAAMQAHSGAALMASHSGQGWQVQVFNTAAARLWPTLQVGMPWATLAPQLTTEVPVLLLTEMAALMQSDHPGDAKTAEASPWWFETFGVPHTGQRGVLLIKRGHDSISSTGDLTSQEGDTFSFTVSHDLRAPIRVVEGFTRIVKEDYGKLLDRVGNDHLDRVLGAAARMNLMIDALLTLARLSTQPLAQQPVNLSQLAAYIADDLRRGTPEREAEIDIEPGLQAHGDPTLLRLVLENLLGNAWKYSQRCHRTQISLRSVPNPSSPHGPPGSNAGRAFVVRDNGAGFDMRSADRLFGLFQRLHSNSDFPGHGVGLASVRRIVKRHGGDIWAEAEVGRGAAFFFTLAG
jgi:signal transduction histidine kinase